MEDQYSETGRPKRITRQPVREAETITAPRPKRKVAEKAPESLSTLLKTPKSSLTTMDISKILNVEVWNTLSLEARDSLAALLPPTAFHDFIPPQNPFEPLPSSESNAMEVDAKGGLGEPSTASKSALLNSAVFTDPHFLAAAHTFQDHLFSGWLQDDAIEKAEVVKNRLRDGTLHAPWKDLVWERDHMGDSENALPRPMQNDSSALAGDAGELKLTDLVKNNVLKEGDIISLKRNFHNILLIEKDALIESINHRSHAITLITEARATQYLSPGILQSSPPPSARSFTVTSAQQLETALLDIDGRVEKSQRPNGNAWKTLSVWREPDAGEGGDSLDHLRGGRENQGTLFYLRGCFYQDR